MSVPDPHAYRDLLAWAYQGEVFGAAFLRILLECGAFPDHRDSLRLLLACEEVTACQLEPLAKAMEVARTDSNVELTASRFAREVATQSWIDFMARTVRIAEEALPQFRALQAVGPAHAADALQAVVEHETALLEFGTRSLQGDVAAATAILTGHLHRQRSRSGNG